MENIYIIGICGGTGAGKSTLARAIINKIDDNKVLLISHDHYYKDRSDLPFSEREKINYDHPDALDTNLLIRHLHDLNKGKVIEIPLYDFTKHERIADGIIAESPKVIILEGILILAEKRLRDLIDLKIFIELEDDLRFIRRLSRDMTERSRTVNSIIRQYNQTVRPMYLQFVNPFQRFADITLYGKNVKSTVDILISVIKNRQT